MFGKWAPCDPDGALYDQLVGCTAWSLGCGAHTVAAKRRYPCRCGSPKCRGTILAKKR